MKRSADLRDHGRVRFSDRPGRGGAAARTKPDISKIDAYSPFPIEELAEAIGFHNNSVPLVTLIGGLAGGISGYLVAVVDRDQSAIRSTWVARPYHSWPAFIVVTFEMTILVCGDFRGVSGCWR